MDEKKSLLKDIGRFLEEAGIAEATFGQRAIGSWTAVARLREDRMHLRQMKRLREYIARQRKAMSDAKKLRRNRLKTDPALHPRPDDGDRQEPSPAGVDTQIGSRVRRRSSV